MMMHVHTPPLPPLPKKKSSDLMKDKGVSADNMATHVCDVCSIYFSPFAAVGFIRTEVIQKFHWQLFGRHAERTRKAWITPDDITKIINMINLLITINIIQRK
jgi:hypothetical protein